VGVHWAGPPCGGGVLVLLNGIDGGLAQRRRASEDFGGLDVAFGVDEGVQANVAGDEIAHGVWWIDGRDGLLKLGGHERRVVGDGFGTRGEGRGRGGGGFCTAREGARV